jgi:HD-like signal output (HDOD) protein
MSVRGLLRRLFGRPTVVVPLPATVATDSAPPDDPPERPDDWGDEAPALELVEAGWWVPRGEPVLAPPQGNGDGQGVHGPLAEYLERLFHDPNLDLPTLPRVPHRALMMLRDPNVDYGKLAAVVKEDPATAADVLRVANSAAYGRLFKVAGLETAFVRLGRRTVRSILMATALKRLTIRTGGTKRTLGEELWQQAIVSGVLLGQIGRRYAMQEDEAFLLGLLHDIGKLALLRILHEYHKTQGGTLSRAIFEGVCAQWHEPLGLRLASAWKLTYPLPAIIGNHHGQPDESDPLYLHRLLVQFADVTCVMLGYGPYVPYDFFALPCVRGLGIEDADRWQNWLTCVPALIAEQAGVF